MCTRYALDITQPELKEIIELAKSSRLTTKFVDTHARPEALLSTRRPYLATWNRLIV